MYASSAAMEYGIGGWYSSGSDPVSIKKVWMPVSLLSETQCTSGNHLR